ncbi:hypothetical protein WG922_07835 [Ramlibacter sp. AN1015]|uniref:hypothetical protein n=1 Tax=Ramlibacter sp. AN1015 TaxID=3133428 RepID=UPI0030BE9C7D
MKHVFACGLFACSFAASAQTIEIKGIYLGMPEADFKQLHPNLNGFTVAGIQSKYSTPYVYFKDGVLDSFSFYFTANGYDDVRAALLTKYSSQFQCEEEIVSTRAGASFKQERCRSDSPAGSVTLSRFVSDISTSSLSMMSRRLIDELKEKQKAKRGDI